MVARVLARGDAWEEDGSGGSGCVLVDGGRESSAFTTGLPLELQNSCVVDTAAAVRIPSFADPMLSLMVRTSCDDRRRGRREGVGAGSGSDGPEMLRQGGFDVVRNRW